MEKGYLSIYLPEEVIEELRKHAAVCETDSIASTVTEIVVKYLALDQSRSHSNSKKLLLQTHAAEAEAEASSMYDADDEPCEVMTSFLESDDDSWLT